MRATARLPAILLAASLALAGCASAAAAPDAEQQQQQQQRQQLARDILEELIQINTTESAGDTHRAAKAMAARLSAAGFAAADVRVFETAPRRGNLVARLRGTVQLNEATRRYFEQLAAFETGQVAADLKAVAAARPDLAAADSRQYLYELVKRLAGGT